MSVEENKALVRHLIEEWNKGNMAAMDELFATDIVHHGGGGEEIRGIKGLKQLLSGFFSAFPDHHTIIKRAREDEGSTTLPAIQNPNYRGRLQNTSRSDESSRLEDLGRLWQ